MRELAEILGFKDSQIYKWHWDQRKKEGMSVEQYQV
jgi:predicted DNA-binding transcriptional regulator AlpA